MSLEFMTMLSKLDCALPALYPEHSNARGLFGYYRVLANSKALPGRLSA